MRIFPTGSILLQKAVARLYSWFSVLRDTMCGVGKGPVERMRTQWNERAGKNPEFWVRTTTLQQQEREFDKSGKEDVDKLVAPLLQLLPCPAQEARLLELGCGVGRHTKHLASLFAEVHALDISEVMLKQAARRCEGKTNVRFYQGNGKDLSSFSDNTFDLAFSYLVLQHIPQEWIIESYVAETSRVLKPSGLIKYQFDGRTSWLNRFLRILLFFGSWRGYAFEEHKLKEMLARAGLRVMELSGARTQYLWVGAKKEKRPVTKSLASSGEP